MTGFGRCEISEGNRKVTVEMKSVNHRCLDVNIKMPKALNFFESAIRNLLKDYRADFGRFINDKGEPYGAGEVTISFNDSSVKSSETLILN